MECSKIRVIKTIIPILILLFAMLSCVTAHKQIAGYVYIRDGKAGVLDSSGEILILNHYKDIHPKSNGVLIATGDNFTDILDSHGTVIKKVERVSKVDESFIIAKSMENKNWGVLNRSGEWVVKPKYLSLMVCSDQNVILAADTKTKKWGILDKTGVWLLSPRFYSIVSCPENGIFRAVSEVSDGGNRFAAFNLNGQRLYGASYDDVWIHNNFAIIARNGKRAVVNKEGHLFFGGWHDKISSYEDGLIIAQDGVDWSLISKDGRNLIQTENLIFREDWNHSFSSQINVYSIQRGARKQVLIIDGVTKKILKTISDVKEIQIDDNKLYITMNTEKKQCLAYHNKSVVAVNCSKKKERCNKVFGSFPVRVKGKACSDFFIKKVGQDYSLVRKDGRSVLPTVYSQIIPPSPFHSQEDLGVIMLQKSKKWGFFDLNSLRQITSIEYDVISPFKNGTAIVRKGHKRFVINMSGEVVFEIDPSYESILIITQNEN